MDYAKSLTVRMPYTTCALLHLCFVVGCARAEGPNSTANHEHVETTLANRSAAENLAAEQDYRNWKFIVLHHTATESGSVESLDKSHQKRVDAAGNPWRGIAYHFLIGNGDGMADGEIRPTFRWLEQTSGAHAGLSLYNEYGIGICLVGNFEKNGPTSAQFQAVSELVSQLKAEFGFTTDQVLRHGDLKATACPGRHFPFEEIASIPPAGPQLANDARKSRLFDIQAGHTEGVSDVVSVLRTSQRQHK